jgi:hypothetical protein
MVDVGHGVQQLNASSSEEENQQQNSRTGG